MFQNTNVKKLILYMTIFFNCFETLFIKHFHLFMFLRWQLTASLSLSYSFEHKPHPYYILKFTLNVVINKKKLFKIYFLTEYLLKMELKRLKYQNQAKFCIYLLITVQFLLQSKIRPTKAFLNVIKFLNVFPISFS